jgi:hypothetical protein
MTTGGAASGTHGERPEAEAVRPSEAAQMIAAIVPALPAEAVADLQALLAMRLEFTTPALAREARLGLLLDLVAVSQGELPDTAAYEAERELRRERGEDWPAASTLARAYNGWDRACRAAIRLHFDGGAARVPANHHHGGDHAPYSRAEILDAIIRFHDSHDQTWPRSGEFFAWGAALRKRARRVGAPDPRIPNAKQVRAAFGEFERAVRAAREICASVEEARESRHPSLP